jgi:hypothetical protein
LSPSKTGKSSFCVIVETPPCAGCIYHSFCGCVDCHSATE